MWDGGEVCGGCGMVVRCGGCEMVVRCGQCGMMVRCVEDVRWW